ncbi:sulfatase [Puniceicoccales bacterium CK1056]|uniref:Sulfatase n=1 Tax=Oceanipulchritudo coccoides TaxID=2706888 RepID=A0A6B2LZG1_9BACT|nr:sulfatase [Oceanipulchritudo coccoides]NDV61542.1 sulfatase [Oceanipulchritudo coccoides]
MIPTYSCKLLVPLILGCCQIAFAGSRPNIVLLFVDDLGWSDLGYRNPGVVETPHIDQLAREAMDFEQCTIATPTCSPSRGTLLTGKHPVRLGLVRHISGGPEEEFSYWKTDPAQVPSRNWMELEHITYAEALKEFGYYNQFIGKWHLGHEPYHPVEQGFDSQIGTTNRGHPGSYYPDYFPDSEVFEEEESAYLTDKLTDAAVGFIESYDKPQPFMLSFWYYSVHSPHIGRKDYVEHFKKKGFEGKYAEYLAMIKSVDDSVGRIRGALESKGIADETILIFLSDQGSYFENKPLRGGKMHDTLFEGGARVPFLFYWPGVTEPVKNTSIVQSTDLFPTLVEIAGGDPGEYPDVDGVSLLNVLRNNTQLERGRPIFGYRAYEDLYASVRNGDWKLLGYRSGKLELYKIDTDIGESSDVSSEFPGRTEEMKAMLVDWEREMGVMQYSGFNK